MIPMAHFKGIRERENLTMCTVWAVWYFCIHLVCFTWVKRCYCKKSIKIFLIKYWGCTRRDVRMILPLVFGCFTLVGVSKPNLLQRQNVPYSDFNNATPLFLGLRAGLSDIWLIADKAMDSVCRLPVTISGQQKSPQYALVSYTVATFKTSGNHFIVPAAVKII